MKILYFAPIDWDFIRQRPQHLSQRLAEHHDFFYIQPLGLRNLKLSDLRRVVKRLLGLFKRQDPKECLKIKNLIFIPIINRYIQPINLHILRKQIGSLTNEETLIWITSPLKIIPDLLSGINFRALVYEMMDDYAKIHPSIEKDITEIETWLINKADLIITTSSALFDKSKRINKNKAAILIGNGVDYEFFNKTSFQKPIELKDMGKIVGYVGTIDKWMDFEAIRFLADTRKDLDFVFVGPFKTPGLPVRRNIHFLGQRNYDTVPHYCNFFDVCLIPFKAGEFADSVNPVKLYEYFALGKPVVAYRMKELIPLNDLLYLAEDKVDFLKKLEFALDETDIEIRLKRKDFAKMNDWSVKAGLLEDALARV
jgi:glycosyltransferase involved in cell wall biosynthesis